MTKRKADLCVYPVVGQPGGICGETRPEKFNLLYTRWSRRRCTFHREVAKVAAEAKRLERSNHRIFEIPQMALDLMHLPWIDNQKLAGERYIEWRQSR